MKPESIAKDGIVVGGMLIVLTLVCMEVFAITVLHQPFSPLDFGGGAAAILGAIGSGAGVRDWLANKRGAAADNIQPTAETLFGGPNAKS